MDRTRLVLAAALAVLVVAAGCSGSDSADPTDESSPTSSTASSTGASPTTTTPPPDCTPARPVPGDSTTGGQPVQAQLDIDGTTRSYTIAVSDSYDGTTAAPMVLNFHGWAGSADQQELNTAMSAEGTRWGFIVVTPDATGSPAEWNMFADPARTPDFEHVGVLVDTLIERLCVDPQRIFAAGHSNGAAFTGFLACKEPFRFAAVAMVAATIPPNCPDGRTPSVLAISGDADPQVPYQGGSVGGGPTRIPGAVETMAMYRERYGCTTTPTITEPVPGVRSERSADCSSGAIVGFDTVAGGTHPWPGGAAAQADGANSDAGRSFDATTAILDFFAAAPPAPAPVPTG